jgi:hypothetical protein
MNPTNESIGRAFRESIDGREIGYSEKLLLSRARELDRQAPGECVGVIAQAPYTDVEWTEAGHNLPIGTRLYAAPQPPAPAQGEDEVATIQFSDPEDEREGPWFSQADLNRLRELKPGTKLYTRPAPPRAGGRAEARIVELEAALAQSPAGGAVAGVIVNAPTTDAEWTEYGHSLPAGTKLYAHPSDAETLRLTEREHEWIVYAIDHMLDDSEPEDQTCAKVLREMLDRCVVITTK